MRNSGRRWVASLLVVLALLPASAAAQFDVLERLVSKAEGFSIYYQYGGLAPGADQLSTSSLVGSASRTGLEGFGIELFISLGAIPGKWELSAEECAEEIAQRGTVDTVDVYTETRTVDERQTTTSVVRTRPRADVCRPPDLAALQLALGYSQLRGFNAADPNIGINGSVAESPAVALYMAFRPQAVISPYVGIRAGRADMHALRAYDTNNTIFDGVASALQAGIAAGISATFLDVFEVVVEPSYVVRNFASVEWRTVSGTSNGMLPAALPRSLNMSSWQVAIGIDFTLPGAK